MGLSQKKLFLLDLDGTIYLEEALLPAFLVCLLWLLLTVTYCLECIRLGKRK